MLLDAALKEKRKGGKWERRVRDERESENERKNCEAYGNNNDMSWGNGEMEGSSGQMTLKNNPID